MFNKLYNLVIIGASTEGLKVAQYITKNAPQLSTILVSTVLKANIDLNINYVQNTVKLITFKRGIYIIWLDNNTTICSTSVIIATGTQPSKLNVEANNIFYKESQLETISKKEHLVILGDSNEAAKLALNASKTWGHVFISYDTLNAKMCSKLELKANITLLPNTLFKDYEMEFNNIKAIKLNTGSLLPCSALMAFTERIPDPNITGVMLNANKNNQYTVEANYEVVGLPNAYAIGNLVPKYSYNLFTKTLRKIKICSFKAIIFSSIGLIISRIFKIK